MVPADSDLNSYSETAQPRRLGIFDSGLGGLVIAKAIHDRMPGIDFVYLGDTLRVPYGSRSQEAIYEFTRQGMEFLFAQGCSLIIIACNTASATALRKLQQSWLKEHYPERNIIGVVVPTLEAAIEQGKSPLGLIGTNYLVGSDVYAQELEKLAPDVVLHQKKTPLLVPLIENDGQKWAPDIMREYLKDLTARDIQCLILGCTHYPFLKKEAREIVGDCVPVISQDEIIPQKLEDYLSRHPEYVVERNGRQAFFVTDVTEHYQSAAEKIYAQNINIQKAVL